MKIIESNGILDGGQRDAGAGVVCSVIGEFALLEINSQFFRQVIQQG
jgi:hypothetical protein